MTFRSTTSVEKTVEWYAPLIAGVHHEDDERGDARGDEGARARVARLVLRTRERRDADEEGQDPDPDRERAERPAACSKMRSL